VNGTKLFLKNKSYSDAFAIIWLRYPDGIYRMYDKAPILADTPSQEMKPQKYYQGDHVIIETWSRGTPKDHWHCKCKHLITLRGLSNTFDVINCEHTHTKMEGASNASSPATIVVSLPADAKLTFDGAPTKSTSANRIFHTPPLEVGVDHHYTLSAEVTRNGRVDTMTQRITVRGGKETRVSFSDAAGTVAAGK
jgi:uncharacterized protein (TIGR03000 family)